MKAPPIRFVCFIDTFRFTPGPLLDTAGQMPRDEE